MAEDGKSKSLDEVLKPFYERAHEAEDRLARLEVLLSNKADADADNKEVSSIIKDFQSEVQIAQAELTAEREKAANEIEKLETENKKLRYHVTHLIRALKEADSNLKIENIKGLDLLKN